MAKKRRKTDEDEDGYVFKAPEFDEREFMKKEVKKTKGAFVTIIYAIVIAVVSYSLTRAGEPALGALLGFAALFLIKFVFDFAGVAVEIYEKKDWAGNGFIFFFTWLGIWILLCNPPFTDLAHPSISRITVLGEDMGNWTAVNETNEHYLINPGENVTIEARITDNVDVVAVSIHVDGYYGTPVLTEKDDHTYSWLVPGIYIQGNASSQEYTFTIGARDHSGNSHVRTGSFTVY